MAQPIGAVTAECTDESEIPCELDDRTIVVICHVYEVAEHGDVEGHTDPYKLMALGVVYEAALCSDSGSILEFTGCGEKQTRLSDESPGNGKLLDAIITVVGDIESFAGSRAGSPARGFAATASHRLSRPKREAVGAQHLAGPAPGRHEHPRVLSVERQALDAIVGGVGYVHERVADRYAPTGRLVGSLAATEVELPRSPASSSPRRDEASVCGELLDSVVGCVHHVYVAVAVDRQATDGSKLAGAGAGGAPLPLVRAGGGENLYQMAELIRDIYAARWADRDRLGLAKDALPRPADGCHRRVRTVRRVRAPHAGQRARARGRNCAARGSFLPHG